MMSGDDPTRYVDCEYAAIVQAESLLRVGKQGLGRDRPASIWDVQAVSPLAALLFAASPRGNDRGIQWVRVAVDNTDPEDVQTPGWAQAALRCSVAATMSGQSVVEMLTAAPRHRNSILAAVRTALDALDATEDQWEQRCG
ncbi:type IV secretion system protein VirD4 [Mycobacterium sp. SMC-4]|jgi:hypothetical protein|uniref:type IV secretion system protein VirD4 n=1 Tax=Mycobacterium sp. SMC-4 TaxID=2857059 RepID=UPI001F3B3794|nr:type IV secretion system protein VirD4 [Mycobacterium sp. SMC-4]MCF6389995.1 type IV secretion system protein VirD4 [Mycobacterium sp. MBM]